MTAPLLCLDFEASGLDPRSYPIEVAIADVTTGLTREWLIAPTSAWLQTGVWEAAAEAMHRLGRAEIIAHGRPVAEVATELSAHTRGAQVLSDMPSHDTKWLRDLYRAIGAEPPFELFDFIKSSGVRRSSAGVALTLPSTRPRPKLTRCFRNSIGPVPTRAETPRFCGGCEK